MKHKLKVLAMFDAIAPTTLDQDSSKELKTEDWKTESHVLKALGLTDEAARASLRFGLIRGTSADDVEAAAAAVASVVEALRR